MFERIIVGLALTSLVLGLFAHYDGKSLWREHMTSGADAYQQGNFSRAEHHWRAALDRAEGGGIEGANLATTLNNLASAALALGNYGEARPLLERSLSLAEGATPPDPDQIAICLNNLATLHYKLGRYARARRLLERARAIVIRTLGPQHPRVAETLNNIAETYHAEGRYVEAEQLMTKALAIQEKMLGPEHPDVAQSLNNMAVLHEDQGDFDGVEALYKRTLAIYEKSRGEDHPDVAMSLENYADYLISLGRTEEARPLLARAALIRTQLDFERRGESTPLPFAHLKTAVPGCLGVGLGRLKIRGRSSNWSVNRMSAIDPKRT